MPTHPGSPAHRASSAAPWPPYHGKGLGIHAILIVYALVAILPVLLIVMNSFKTRAAIFTHPYLPPLPGLFTLIGYQTMFERAHFARYFANTAIVAGPPMTLIRLLGAMAGFALAAH